MRGQLTAEQFLTVTKRLLASLACRPEPEFRLAVLNRLCGQLGDNPYPGFLKVLLTAAESEDSDAKALLADTLGFGLQQMNLPCGELNAWGTQTMPQDRSDSAFTRSAKRSLGPIEYLTVWSCQQTQRLRLSDATYRRVLNQLIALCNYSASARRLYPDLLRSEAAERREGTYTKASRERLLTIARCWTAGQEPAAIAASALTSGAAIPVQYAPNWVLRDL